MIGKIAFIGAGAMAEAIISGIVEGNIMEAKDITVTNRSNQERLTELNKCYGVEVTQDKEAMINHADIIVLSMKPNDVATAIKPIKGFIKPNQLIISVIAGITTDQLLEVFGIDVAIVRAMPNTSAFIGKSATAITPGVHTTKQQLEISELLFKTIGMCIVIEEKDMHTVTSISGSGPAYIYYLVEAMEEAAIESGLDKDVAHAFITQTIIGAGEMLKQTDKPTQTLRREITSPSGTTEAGLKALMDHNFKDAVHACVKSARTRSIELSAEVFKQ